MTKANLRYLSNEAIEDVTAQRIRQYEAKAGVKVGFPVPAEEVIEQVLGLCFLWDQIEEQPGEMILGGLSRKSRTIVLNEKHLELFEQKPWPAPQHPGPRGRARRPRRRAGRARPVAVRRGARADRSPPLHQGEPAT